MADTSDWHDVSETIGDTLHANGHDDPVRPGAWPTLEPRAHSSPEQLPLFPQRPASEPYPINALGPVLALAARAIASKVQVPDAMAANSVLAVAALAAQAHADVVLPYGQSRPLSLFAVTIAGSGDRKTTADREALWPVHQRERALAALYTGQQQTYVVARSAWEAEKRAIERKTKISRSDRRELLTALGLPPEEPRRPFLVASEPTIEGLIKAWSAAHESLGIFSPEGGLFIGGHGMSPENQLRTAAGYSELWDGQPIKRIRALEGVSLLRGRRLSMHLMAQLEVATEFLSDPVLRDQGLLSRFLVAAPESLAGDRPYREPRLEDELALRAYSQRILDLLEAPWPLAGDRLDGLTPWRLPLSAPATSIWREFYDAVERGTGSDGAYSTLRDLASKMAEHAARIAAVLAIVADPEATTIDDASMQGAVILAQWYLDEALRLLSGPRANPHLIAAQKLLTWLTAQGTPEVPFADILQRAPGATRTKKEAEQALRLLRAHGWIEETSQRPRTVRLLGIQRRQ